MLDLLRASPDVTNAIGVVGFFLYILGFNLVQVGRMCGNGVAYAATNVIAAAFVLISLVNAFNMASFLIQISFIAIGVVGIARKAYRNRFENRPLRAHAVS